MAIETLSDQESLSFDHLTGENRAASPSVLSPVVDTPYLRLEVDIEPRTISFH